MVNIDNEKKYLLSQLSEARKKGDAGLEDWARSQAQTYGFDLDKVAMSPAAQLTAATSGKSSTPSTPRTAQQMAAGVGVTGPIDPGFAKAVETGTPYMSSTAAPQLAAVSNIEPAAKIQTQSMTSGTSALKPTYKPVDFQALLNAVMAAKQPLLNRQQDALNRQTKGAAAALNQQMAGMGRLNSGQTISEQRKLQEGSLRTLGDLNAQARADAVGQAFQYGGLQLQQQGQEFGQNEAVQNFLQDLAQYQRGIFESDRGYGRGVLESDRTFGLNQRNTESQERQVGATISGIDPATGLLTQAAIAQQADISLAQRGQEWQEIMGAAKLGQTDKQIALAERNQDFNEWATKQGISQDWQRLSIQEKKDAVDKWATLRGLDYQQQGLDLESRGLDIKAQESSKAETKAGGDMMQEAVKLAQNDLAYQNAETFEEKQRIINKYYDILAGGKNGQAASGNQFSDDELLKFTN